MNIKYRVDLSQEEREQLEGMLKGGKLAARKLVRAQILLAADKGISDGGIAGALQVSGSTIYRTKRRFVADNLEGALSDEPRPGAERKLSTKETALLAATACSAPPPGRARWTLELLADEMVKLTDHDELSRETVRRRLAENHLKPWRRTMWCIPKVDGEYVARMEDVLDLYAQPPDPLRPVICFDESPTQLIGEVRQPIPAEPGQLERYDCEYRRNGTVNLFIFLDANRSWRKVKVTDRRTNKDFAECMRDLVDLHYPTASAIRLVMDNLSNSFHRRALRRFSGARGAPHPQADRVPLHAKTRQLAEQGRNRNRRPARPMPGPPHRGQSLPHLGNRRLGKKPKRQWRNNRMDLHNRKSSPKTQKSLSSQRVMITVQRY